MPAQDCLRLAGIHANYLKANHPVFSFHFRCCDKIPWPTTPPKKNHLGEKMNFKSWFQVVVLSHWEIMSWKKLATLHPRSRASGNPHMHFHLLTQLSFSSSL